MAGADQSVNDAFLDRVDSLHAQGAVLSPAELVRRVRSGPGPGSLGDAQLTAEQQMDEQHAIDEEISAMSGRLESVWSGDGGEAARTALRPLSTASFNAALALRDSQRSLADQAHAFQSMRDSMREVSDQAPSLGLIDHLTPWNTSAENQLNQRNADIEQNNRVYHGFSTVSAENSARMPQNYGKVPPALGGIFQANLGNAHPAQARLRRPATWLTARHLSKNHRGTGTVKAAPVAGAPAPSTPAAAPPAPTAAPETVAPQQVSPVSAVQPDRIAVPAPLPPGRGNPNDTGTGRTQAAGWVPEPRPGTHWTTPESAAARTVAGNPLPDGGPIGHLGAGASGGREVNRVPGGRSARLPGGPGTGTGTPRGRADTAGRAGATATRESGAGVPVGTGAGRGKEAEREKTAPAYLLEPDPACLFGYDGPATPPVLGA